MTIKDKEFEPFIPKESISQRVQELGKQISKDFKNECPILIGILSGSFMFMSDLAKNISIPIEISFTRIASYEGVCSTGNVKELIGIDVDLSERTVLLVEDIVDTGLSMDYLLKMIQKLNPKRTAIVALLLKPEALKYKFDLEYVGFEIPDKFVVGYGLDYAGLGRNLPEIYQLK